MQRNTELINRTTTLLKPKNENENTNIMDFNLIKVLGKGAFGKVVLAEKN